MLSVTRSVARGLTLVRPELSAIRSMTAEASASTETMAPAAPGPKPPLEKSFLVYRWNPDSGEAPKYQEYKVDINA